MASRTLGRILQSEIMPAAPSIRRGLPPPGRLPLAEAVGAIERCLVERFVGSVGEQVQALGEFLELRAAQLGASVESPQEGPCVGHRGWRPCSI